MSVCPSFIAVIFEVCLQFFGVVAGEFAFKAKNISVLVEEEVVFIVTESAKSSFVQRIGIVDVDSLKVATLLLSFF